METLQLEWYLRFLFGTMKSASVAGVKIFCKSIGFEEDFVVEAFSSYKTFDANRKFIEKCLTCGLFFAIICSLRGEGGLQLIALDNWPIWL